MDLSNLFQFNIDSSTHFRMLEPADAPKLFAVIDRERAHISRFDTWPNLITNESEALEWLNRHQECFLDSRGIFTGVLVDGELAGMCGIREMDWNMGTAECSYWLAKRFTGRGIVTLGLRRFADHLLLHRQFLKLEIRCNSQNLRSIAVAERLGFRLEATMRGSPTFPERLPPVNWYSLLQEEWLARRQKEEPGVRWL